VSSYPDWFQAADKLSAAEERIRALEAQLASLGHARVAASPEVLPEQKKLKRTDDGPPTCTVCLEDVKEQPGVPLARLSCGHEFHLECIAIAFSAKSAMVCPSCRHKELGDWRFSFDRERWEHESEMDSERRRALEERYVSRDGHDEAVARWMQRRENMVSQIVRRTLGVVEGQTGQQSGGLTAVMVPVPCVPVDALDELQAMTCGMKRTIVMPGSIHMHGGR
jgi:hypothetical protein